MVTAISKSPRRPVDVGKATSSDIFPNPGIHSTRVPIVGRAAIYTRVSTDRQQDGASLEVQLEQCRRYCEGHGLSVIAEFRDVLSGLNPDRPKYRQAIDLAKSKQVDKLIVWRLDRLTVSPNSPCHQMRFFTNSTTALSHEHQPAIH